MDNFKHEKLSTVHMRTSVALRESKSLQLVKNATVGWLPLVSIITSLLELVFTLVLLYNTRLVSHHKIGHRVVQCNGGNGGPPTSRMLFQSLTHGSRSR